MATAPPLSLQSIPPQSVPPLEVTPEFLLEPKQVLDRAEQVAKALQEFLDRKEDNVVFNGKRYPKAEDWQFVGAFFGHTARVCSTKKIRNDDNVMGYIADVEVVNGAGRIVSAASAACMRDEPNWARKPDFQLRSMAQTRACAKGLKNVFSWVMVLAGLAPTPAEEMGEGNREPLPASDAIAKRCAALANAPNLGELRRLYTEAFNDAKKTKDPQALVLYNRATNARKREL